MSSSIFKELINNTALLLALSIIFEARYMIPQKWERFVPAMSGVLIGLIGIFLMTTPFTLISGITFDTRSILISVSALTFGPIPVSIAGAITIYYRFIQGGTGALAGSIVIIVSAVIGLIWRRILGKYPLKHQLLNTYFFGITVHISMLICMFIMPISTAIDVLSEIAVPVIVIYPLGTVLLTYLLLHQKLRHDAQNQLVDTQRRYKSLFDNNHAVVLLINPQNGHIIDANPAACRFYGWNIDAIKRMNISDINILSSDAIKKEMEDAILQNRNYFIFKHRNAAERIIDVEVYSGPIEIDNRTLLYSIVHDVSSRAASERALIESESRFRSLIELAPDAIYIQTNQLFSYVNHAAVQLFGANSSSDLIGKPVMERFHPSFHKTVKDRIRLLNDGKKAVPPIEQIYIRLDGSYVNVDVTAVPINFNNTSGALVFARDISERKRIEAMKNSIEAQQRQSQKLEAIGTLAGGVAHEINNPINGIMNYAELILDLAEPNGAQAGYAREIITETERVSAIVKNLLQFSRQEKQAHSYASIYDIINQTISLISVVFKKDRINMVLKMDDNLPQIKCRSQQIQQVLMNLLTNARDALNEKYLDYNDDKIIRLTCSAFMRDNRRWILIVIEDNGCGIDPEIKDKIFEPFFSTKSKDVGTGLGLSISYGIVADHHGTLACESEFGKYSKFILSLPVDNGWELT